jgi:competence protein ComEC
MAHPALLPALAILAGAFAGATWAPPASVLVVASVAGWVAAVASFVRPSHRSFLTATCLAFFAASCGIAAIDEHEARKPSLRELVDAGLVGDTPVTLEGHLREDAAPGEQGASLSVSVERLTVGGRIHQVSGGALLTVGGRLAAQRLQAWRRGRRVSVSATLREPGRSLDPGVPDNAVRLARRGTTLVGSVKSGALVEVLASGGWLAEAAARARSGVRVAVARAVGRWSARSAAIVVAILIGDRAGLDEEAVRRLQEAGTYHVIAISGGNIAILAGLILWLLGLVGPGWRGSSWSAIALLVGYAYLVGGQSSVTRATLMAVTYLVARAVDHRSAPLNALAVSAAIILVASPLSVFDSAFALTFGATAGILLGASRLLAVLPRWRVFRPLAALFVASLSAEIALVPIAASAFSRVTFAGLGLNFFAIPLMTVVQVAGMALVPVYAVQPGLAALVGYVAHLGAYWLIESAALVDLVPWLSYRVPPPSAVTIALYYAGWTAWLLTRHGSEDPIGWRRRLMLGRAALVVVCGSGLWVLTDPPTLVESLVGTGTLRVTCLDVGHGDAIALQLPNGRTLLVDAGGTRRPGGFDVGERVVAPALWALGIRRLEAFVLTHPDPDHLGGADAILHDFAIGEIWEGVPVPGDAAWRALRARARQAGIAWRTLQRDEVQTTGGVEIRVWHPPPPEWERHRPRNDDSLVLEVRFGEVSVVLAGDISREVEQGLLGRVSPAGVRVLKVPHHGSRSSSSPEFLAALRPTLALLTVGSGERLPGLDEVLDRYRAAGAVVLRTDIDGAITIETDGRVVSVTTFTGRQVRFTAARGQISNGR